MSRCRSGLIDAKRSLSKAGHENPDNEAVGLNKAVVERHAMSKKGPETKKAEKSRENIKKAQFYVEFHAKPGDKLQKGA